MNQELTTYLARLTRKLILRGRAAVGYYSMEGYQPGSDDIAEAAKYGLSAEQPITAQRYQHYGFVSEPPDGSEVIVQAINGGASNRAAIAEHVTDEPAIAQDEVLLWSRFGQRVLLTESNTVSLDNGDGGTAVLAGDLLTVTEDVAVTRDVAIARDLSVARDAKVNHLLGGGDTVLTVSQNSPVITGAVAVGDGLSFELSFGVGSSQTLTPTALIATVTLPRAYATIPRCMVSASATGWPTNGVSFSATATSTSEIEVHYQGANVITAGGSPITGLQVTVVVFGKT